MLSATTIATIGSRICHWVSPAKVTPPITPMLKMFAPKAEMPPSANIRHCTISTAARGLETRLIARWARETGYEVRFIEYMPLDAEQHWEREKVVPSAELLDAIGDLYLVGHPLLGAYSAHKAGHALNNAPRWAGRLWLQWSGHLTAADLLSFTAEASAQSTVFFTPFNDVI